MKTNNRELFGFGYQFSVIAYQLFGSDFLLPFNSEHLSLK